MAARVMVMIIRMMIEADCDIISAADYMAMMAGALQAHARSMTGAWQAHGRSMAGAC